MLKSSLSSSFLLTPFTAGSAGCRGTGMRASSMCCCPWPTAPPLGTASATTSMTNLNRSVLFFHFRCAVKQTLRIDQAACPGRKRKSPSPPCLGCNFHLSKFLSQTWHFSFTVKSQFHRHQRNIFLLSRVPVRWLPVAWYLLFYWEPYFYNELVKPKRQ